MASREGGSSGRGRLSAQAATPASDRRRRPTRSRARPARLRALRLRAGRPQDDRRLAPLRCWPAAGQRLAELAGRSPAVGRQLLQRGEDRGLDRRRHGGPLGPERGRLLGEHLGDDRLGAGPGEGRLPGQHLVAHRTQGVDVAPGVDLALAHRLLGRHVGRRAERHPGLRHPAAAGLVHREGDAEVGHQRRPVLQQDVLRLDVAVHHAVAVGVVERGRRPRG